MEAQLGAAASDDPADPDSDENQALRAATEALQAVEARLTRAVGVTSAARAKITEIEATKADGGAMAD